MNNPILLALQTEPNKYGNLLSDFEAFKCKVMDYLQRIEAQIEQIVDRALEISTYNGTYTKFLKGTLTIDNMIDDLRSRIEKIQNNLPLFHKAQSSDIIHHREQFNRRYGEILNSFDTWNLQKMKIFEWNHLQKHPDIQIKQNHCKLVKSDKVSYWSMAIIGPFDVQNSDMIRLKVVKATLANFGIISAQMALRSQYRKNTYKGSHGALFFSQNGDIISADTVEKADFNIQKSDIISLSILYNELIILNENSGKSIRQKIKNDIYSEQWQFVVGLRQDQDMVELL